MNHRLAVDYLFLVNDGQGVTTDIDFEPFNARSALNDYEVSASTNIPLFVVILILLERFHGLFAIYSQMTGLFSFSPRNLRS